MQSRLADIVEEQEGPVYDLRPKVNLVIDISKVGEILATTEGVVYFLQKSKVIKQFKEEATKIEFFDFVLAAKVKHAKNSAVAIEQSEFLETYIKDLTNRLFKPLSDGIATITTMQTTAMKEGNATHAYLLTEFLKELKADSSRDLKEILGETKVTLDRLSDKVDILNKAMGKPVAVYVEE